MDLASLPGLPAPLTVPRAVDSAEHDADDELLAVVEPGMAGEGSAPLPLTRTRSQCPIAQHCETQRASPHRRRVRMWFISVVFLLRSAPAPLPPTAGAGDAEFQGVDAADLDMGALAGLPLAGPLAPGVAGAGVGHNPGDEPGVAVGPFALPLGRLAPLDGFVIPAVEPEGVVTPASRRPSHANPGGSGSGSEHTASPRLLDVAPFCSSPMSPFVKVSPGILTPVSPFQ